ncbi:hypothetical protein OIY81_3601, partial [Cryptosporidium canis]
GRGVSGSEGRAVRSLPPALGGGQAGGSGGGPEEAQDTGSVGIDLYLTNVALQSCVESYSRRLYNICRMIDVDSGSDSEGLADGAYFSELDYGIPIRGSAAGPAELAKTQVRISDGPGRAREGAPVSLPDTQPQISGETISETASKWSIRLRSGPGPGKSPDVKGNPLETAAQGEDLQHGPFRARLRTDRPAQSQGRRDGSGGERDHNAKRKHLRAALLLAVQHLETQKQETDPIRARIPTRKRISTILVRHLDIRL